MYNILTNLITKGFYADRTNAINKVDMCFGMAKITQEQYINLSLLIDEKYPA